MTAAVPPPRPAAPSRHTSQTLAPPCETTQARRVSRSGLSLRRERPSPGSVVEAEEHVSNSLSMIWALFFQGFLNGVFWGVRFSPGVPSENRELVALSSRFQNSLWAHDLGR